MKWYSENNVTAFLGGYITKDELLTRGVEDGGNALQKLADYAEMNRIGDLHFEHVKAQLQEAREAAWFWWTDAKDGMELGYGGTIRPLPWIGGGLITVKGEKVKEER